MIPCRTMLTFLEQSCVSFSAAGNPVTLAIGTLVVAGSKVRHTYFSSIQNVTEVKVILGNVCFHSQVLLQSYVKHDSLCLKNANLR